MHDVCPDVPGVGLRFHLPQNIVYWPPNGADAEGRPVQSPPVQFPGRWENRVVETIDKDGNMVYSSATVYLKDQVFVSGFLYLGPLSDTRQPNWKPELRANVRVREIIAVESTPSLKADQSLVVAMLK